MNIFEAICINSYDKKAKVYIKTTTFRQAETKLLNATMSWSKTLKAYKEIISITKLNNSTNLL